MPGGVSVRFALPSVLLGYGVGVGTVLLGKRLRPLALELATILYRFTEAVAARGAMKQETLDNLLAEARVLVRGSDKTPRQPRSTALSGR